MGIAQRTSAPAARMHRAFFLVFVVLFAHTLSSELHDTENNVIKAEGVSPDCNAKAQAVTEACGAFGEQSAACKKLRQQLESSPCKMAKAKQEGVTLGEGQEKKKAAGLDDAKKAPPSKDKATKEKAPQKKDANKPQDTNLGEAGLEAEASQAGWGRRRRRRYHRRRRRRRWMHSPRERGQKRAVRVRV